MQPKLLLACDELMTRTRIAGAIALLGWAVPRIAGPETLARWEEILEHRVVLLDLKFRAMSAEQVIDTVRRTHCLNTIIIGFGPHSDERIPDLKRRGMDRFYPNSKIVPALPEILAPLAE